jgi:RND superfamily putative drug exporter
MDSSPAASRLGRLGAWCFEHRWRTLVAWVAALALAVIGGGAIAGDMTADYATPGSDSQAASQLIGSRFDHRSDRSVDLVWSAPAGADAPAVRAQVERVLDRAGALPGLDSGPTFDDAELSPDGTVGVVRIGLDIQPDAVPRTTGAALRRLANGADDGVTMALSGGIGGLQGQSGLSSEAVGLIVAALVLLVTFGTVVAAGLPLLSALFGLGISSAGIGVIATFMDVPDWAPQVGAMLGIGMGIDYALLVLTRQRAGIGRGLTPVAAISEAMATAGRSVLVAGLTVSISLFGLFLMGLPYLYGVSIAAMLAVGVVVVSALTLLPALLGMAGRSIDRLRIPGTGHAPADPMQTRSARWARGVQRRPVIAAAVALIVLIALSFPVTGLRLGQPDAGNDLAGSTTRVAYDLLADGFGPGANGPLTVVAQTPGAAGRAAMDRLPASLREEGDVAAVGPVTYNAQRDAALIAVTPRGTPQDASTQDLVTDLRDGPLADSRLKDVHVGGATAASVDQAEATTSRLPLFIGGVVGLSFLLLLAAFRAPVVALKAATMNLLSIGAAYGVIALLAEGGWAGQLIGIDTDMPIPPFIPVMLFAILFGLSMDYEVFLLSRIREERDRLGSTADAVVSGVARTAPVITAAALIMVAVFGAFALSPEPFLKLIGLGMATAILVDATIVRLVLVPAVMQLLGERNWWMPAWLDRVLPRGPLAEPADPAPA